MTDAVKRKLQELRVVDLRAELESRGLDKTGVKATLLERLEQSLINDGDDPATFQFMVVESASAKKLPRKKKGEMNETEGDEDDDDEQTMESLSDFPPAERRVDEENSVERTENTLNRTNNDDGDEELVVGLDGGDDVNDVDVDDNNHIKVPNPENVEPQCPFTSEDTIKLHAAATAKKKISDLEAGGVSDEANSLFVNADETLSDLDQTETSSLGASLLFGNGGGVGTTTATDGGGRSDFKTINETSADDAKGVYDETDKGTFDERTTPKNVSSPPVLSTTTTTNNETENHTSSSKAEPKTESVDASNESKNNEKSVMLPASTGKSIWVMGISVSTKAADLKSLFSKYGRVATAKVISSKTKVDGPKWFGFITMATADDASKCIQHLHRTELHGKMISVERTSSNSTMPPRKVVSAVSESASSKKPALLSSTTTSIVVPVPSSTDANNSGTASMAETNQKSAKNETLTKSDEKEKYDDDKVGEKSSEAAEKKKDEIVDKSKDKTDKKESKSRTRSRSKERRRPSSKERRSRDREIARRRELASRQPRRPFVSSRPPYRPPRPLMSGRFQRPPPTRQPTRPTHNDYRNRDNATMQRARLLEMRTERERDIIERMRQKEAEHKRREEVLRLEREKERLKFEREKLEREKAELQYQHKQILLQAAYEQRLQQQPTSLIGVKRPYGDVSAYPGSDAKRYAGSSGVGARGGGRDRTPPRYGGSSRDTSRNERFDSRSSRVDSGSRSGGRDDYRTGGSSSSSRRPEPVRSSRSGVGDRRYASPPRRGREAPPPPPPPRPNTWGASSSSASSRHVANAGGGSSGARDNRVTSSSSGYSSRQSGGGGGYNSNRGPPPTVPAAWAGPTPIVQNTNWGRPGQLQTAVSTGVWAPQAPNTLFGGVASNLAPSNNSYGAENRFDGYKYNSTSSVRRY